MTVAKLTKEQTVTVAKVLVRTTTLLKGRAFDLARMSFSSDRQFDAYRFEMKNYESYLRQGFMSALVAAGLTDDPMTAAELAELK